MTELLTPVPAATIILLREVPGGPPHLLLIERAAKMAFAAGAAVFPGGRVDPDDFTIAQDPALATVLPDRDDAAARVAAIRECLEEAGLAIGFSAPAERVAEMRANLHTGAPLSSMLVRHGLALDLAALTPFTRWRPDIPGNRRFDTRFYLAAAPDGIAVADGSENVKIIWENARGMLAAGDAGEHLIVFPTRRNLERLAQWASTAEIYADAAAFPSRLVSTFIEMRDGEPHLCLSDGHGYPVVSEPVATAKRASRD